MWKDKIRGYAIVEYRVLLFMRAAILISILFAAVQLVRSYAKYFEPQSEAATRNSGYSVLCERPYLPDMKQAIMGWMKKSSEMPDEILSHIYDEAMKNPNSDLLLAICKVESNFNPVTKSRRDAFGLMGVRPEVWLTELKEKRILQSRRDLYLIPTNLASGAYVLQKYILRRGKLEEALNDYVGGDPAYARSVVQALGEIYTARMVYAQSHNEILAEADREKKKAQPDI